ncbi:hypothetical protein [Streptomyces sp. NPDC059943]|uniref:hypothetical protein n=1 Tax=Streptomyces sp. NPDC059943 TaxID=3347010 RepID=UPI003648806E
MEFVTPRPTTKAPDDWFTGDVTVTCPPGEEHWHGATPERFMEHLAMWEAPGDDRPETTWLEKVSDDLYNATRVRGGH